MTANEEDKPTVDPKLLEAKRNEVLGEIQRKSNREQLERQVKIAMSLPISERIHKHQLLGAQSDGSPDRKSARDSRQTEEFGVEDAEEGGHLDWTPNTVVAA